jgi:aminoglycoside phosphotransferase (APT) family kinase protein
MNNYDDFRGTRPVAEAHRFDVAALERYLGSHMPGFEGPVEVEQFKGGQSNPTFLLRGGAKRYVLRRKPPGKLLPSAHAVDREYRVITALAQSDVPVGRTYCLCTDESVIGSMFYLMDYVEGRVLWDPLLPGMQPSERRAVFDEMNRVIAALHRVDFQAIGLADYGKPGNYFARQIDRWSRQYKASETEKIEAMDRLIEWLPTNIPPGDATTIVHGDYRLDNMIFHPSEPRVLAVLDWELSTLGDPLADFAYYLMAWDMPPSPSGVGFGSLAGRDLGALGIPTRAAEVEAYRSRTGLDPGPHLATYLAYNFFRVAAILQGIAGRVRDGTATSDNAAGMATMVRPLAAKAWQLAQETTA